MADNEFEAFAKAISRVLGWMYFLSWYVPSWSAMHLPYPIRYKH
jgi:hypothetical protein